MTEVLVSAAFGVALATVGVLLNITTKLAEIGGKLDVLIKQQELDHAEHDRRLTKLEEDAIPEHNRRIAKLEDTASWR